MLYAVGIIGYLSWYGADGPEIELVSTPFIKGESWVYMWKGVLVCIWIRLFCWKLKTYCWKYCNKIFFIAANYYHVFLSLGWSMNSAMDKPKKTQSTQTQPQLLHKCTFRIIAKWLNSSFPNSLDFGGNW